MAAPTWLELYTDTLLDLGVLAAGEVPTTDDIANCNRAMNRLIDQWKADNLLIYQQGRTTWTIVSGTGTYTVGTGGTVNIPRPSFIEHVRVQDTNFSPTVEYQGLTKLSDDDYARLNIKDLQATLPQCYYYNPTFPTGTLKLWPIPTSTTLQGVLYYAGAAVDEVSSLAATLSLPPGYRRMLEKSLAVEVAPSYQREVAMEIRLAAMDAVNTVMRSNVRFNELTCDPGAVVQGTGRWNYSIRTDR